MVSIKDLTLEPAEHYIIGITNAINWVINMPLKYNIIICLNLMFLLLFVTNFSRFWQVGKEYSAKQ